MSAVSKLPIKWVHETFGKKSVVKRWFFPIKHRLRRFYKSFHGTPGMRPFGADLLLSLLSTPYWRLKVSPFKKYRQKGGRGIKKEE